MSQPPLPTHPHDLLAIADASICPLSSLLVEAKLDHLYAIIVVATGNTPARYQQLLLELQNNGWTFTRQYVSFAFQPHTVAYFQYRTRAIWSTSLTSGFVS
jgi:hypothetical protein